MRLRNVTGSREVIADSPSVIHDPELKRGRWAGVFGNGNPIHIEIGTGKGRFISQMAEDNPKINYVGIEKYSSVLIKAVQKKEERRLANLCFIRMDAEMITEVFGDGEVERIYLNFSDPWPKDRHAKRRLPSLPFLERYDVILSSTGTVEFKTDNRALFDFALEELEGSPFRAAQVTYDLHSDSRMNAGNVMTEYEEKFSSLGNPIYKYVLTRV